MYDESIEKNVISICKNLGIEPVEKVLVSENEYRQFYSICVVFKSGRCKIVELQNFGVMTNPYDMNQMIIDQLKEDIPYMDRKTREIYG